MKFLAVFILAFATFVAGSVIRNQEPIAPTYDPFSECRLFLQTRDNRGSPVELVFGNLNSVLESPYRPHRPLRVWIHGWNGGPNTGANSAVGRALLDNDDFNFIHLDWSAGAQTGVNYIAAVNNVPPTGQFLGAFLDWLDDNNLIQLDQVSLVGFSLGAHVAGFTGKSVHRGRVGTIFALDPAGPLFPVGNPAQRVAQGDALYVEGIHTDSLASGIGAPIGDADFFPNGGRNQPGCTVGSGCSHGRAPEFYMESVVDNRFVSSRCATLADAENGNCTVDPNVRMGGEPSNHRLSLRGIFHLTTNGQSPFGQA